MSEKQLTKPSGWKNSAQNQAAAQQTFGFERYKLHSLGFRRERRKL